MQKILAGDTVKIMLGKDNGKSAKVIRILAKVGKVYVEGINMVKRHVKKTGQNEGGIIEIIKPLKLSNVMLVCPNCEKATRVGVKIDGLKKVRICRKCGKEIATKVGKK